jgi:hypothetical protein
MIRSSSKQQYHFYGVIAEKYCKLSRLQYFILYIMQVNRYELESELQNSFFRSPENVF